jgi:hypothetical protein
VGACTLAAAGATALARLTATGEQRLSRLDRRVAVREGRGAMMSKVQKLTASARFPTVLGAWSPRGKAGAPRINVQGGTEMGRWRGKARRVIAAVAVTDLAYRLFMRAPLRRALGIEAKHA